MGLFYFLISWLTTVVFLLFFVITLLIFHPLQLIALKFGYSAHKFILDLMNILILKLLGLTGANFKIKDQNNFEPNDQLIIISNHQSMFDIPLIIWHFRHFNPKFIAKRELGRFIPSISLGLRNMGSVMINRSERSSALAQIENFAKSLLKTGYSVCIFPEGTRARDGKIKAFKKSGTITLLKKLPQAKVIPIVFDRSWELLKFKLAPIPFGIKVTMQVLPALNRENRSAEELFEEAEDLIRERLLSSIDTLGSTGQN